MGVDGVRGSGSLAPPTFPEQSRTVASEPDPPPDAVRMEVARQGRGPSADGNGRLLRLAVDDLRRAAQVFNRELEFTIHEATDRVMVRVINKETGKVVREIPLEVILNLVAQMRQLLGLLFDEWA